MTPMPRIKYTARVRRGLAAMEEIVDAAFDDRQPPAPSIVEKWTKAKQSDFNLAKDWITQEVLADAAPAPTEATPNV